MISSVAPGVPGLPRSGCRGGRTGTSAPLRAVDECPRTQVRCRPTVWTLLGCRPVTTTRPVVLIAEELAPSVLEVLGSDVEIRHVDGTDRGALLPALADAAAVLVRSATQIDAEALAAAPNLKVVARAGIGLDNVDVAAATERGVM